MRFLPQSLFGRLMLVLASGLIVAQLLSAVINLAERDTVLVRVMGMQPAQRIADVVRLLDSLSPAERERIVSILNVPPMVVSLDRAPGVRGIGFDERRSCGDVCCRAAGGPRRRATDPGHDERHTTRVDARTGSRCGSVSYGRTPRPVGHASVPPGRRVDADSGASAGWDLGELRHATPAGSRRLAMESIADARDPARRRVASFPTSACGGSPAH